MKSKSKELTFSDGKSSFAIKLSTIEAPKVDALKISKQSEEEVFWGDKKNSFVKYLADTTAVKSPEHAAIVDTKSKYIYSGGLTVSGESAKQVEAFLKTITSRNRPANFLFRKYAENEPRFEISYFEVIYGKGLKKIVKINPIQITKIVPNKELDEYGEVISYTFCNDFTNTSADKVVIPRFDTVKPAEKQIMAIYTPSVLQPYYPDVSYGSAFNYIELSNSISKYLLSYSENGMFSSGFFNIQTDSNIDAESFLDIETQLLGAFSGVHNAGRVFVFANENKDAVTFNPLSTTDNTSWILALNDLVISKICSIHKVNPMIVGISKDGGGFSSAADEANEMLRQFYLDQIEPAQEMFLDFMNQVLDFNGFKDYELSVITPAKLKPEIPEMIIEQLTIKKKAELYGLDVTDFIDYIEPITDIENQDTEEKEDNPFNQ